MNMPSIPVRLVGKLKQIIRTHIIKARKENQNRGRNIALTEFVIAVYLLGAVEHIGDLLLRQVVILSQFSNPLEHSRSFPLITVRNTKIIPYRILLY